jgi:hypothetical protein
MNIIKKYESKAIKWLSKHKDYGVYEYKYAGINYSYTIYGESLFVKFDTKHYIILLLNLEYLKFIWIIYIY